MVAFAKSFGWTNRGWLMLAKHFLQIQLNVLLGHQMFFDNQFLLGKWVFTEKSRFLLGRLLINCEEGLWLLN
jgi:hypothetical protein